MGLSGLSGLDDLDGGGGCRFQVAGGGGGRKSDRTSVLRFFELDASFRLPDNERCETDGSAGRNLDAVEARSIARLFGHSTENGLKPNCTLQVCIPTDALLAWPKDHNPLERNL